MELIRIQQHNGNQVVSARELHNFLESKQQFANWIQNRINDYGFIENQDFEVFNNFIKNPNGGRPLKEYALTIDTAKEIAMVEGNEKGKQARRYFIECEKKLKVIQHPSIPQSYSEALKLAYEQAEKIEEQSKLINKQQHYVNFVEQCFDENKEDLIALREACKLLGMPYGHHTFIKVLSFYGLIFKNRKGDWVPKQSYVDRGYFVLKQSKKQLKEFSVINSVTLVTQKGLAYLTARKKRLINIEVIEASKNIK